MGRRLYENPEYMMEMGGTRSIRKITGHIKKATVKTVAFLHLSVFMLPARLLASAQLAETLVEALNTAASIHHLLSAGVEWVALGADFDAQRLAQRRASVDFVTAAAGNFDCFVVRMDILLHLSFLELVYAAT